MDLSSGDGYFVLFSSKLGLLGASMDGQMAQSCVRTCGNTLARVVPRRVLRYRHCEEPSSECLLASEECIQHLALPFSLISWQPEYRLEMSDFESISDHFVHA